MKQKKLVMFLDTVGRTVVGELDEQTETILKVKNPAILNVAPAEGGRMVVQILPIVFKEFLADRTENTIWNYNKGQITVSSIETLDVRLQKQYEHMFDSNNVFVPPGSGIANAPATSETASKEEPKILNLFD